MYYDQNPDLNADVYDDAIKQLVKEAITEDAEEIEELGYKVSEVTNGFIFAQKQKDLNSLKSHLSSASSSFINWDYEDYENCCNPLEVPLNHSYNYP